MFKREIDRFLQHTNQQPIISTVVHFGTVSNAVKKISIGIKFI